MDEGEWNFGLTWDLFGFDLRLGWVVVGFGIGFELGLGKGVGREHTSSFSSSKYFFQRKFGPLGGNPNCGYPNVLRSFLVHKS